MKIALNLMFRNIFTKYCTFAMDTAVDKTLKR